MPHLTPYNPDNESVVEKMVRKAMCAYANCQEVEEIPYLADGATKVEAKCRFDSEYEAIVQCIGLLVEQPTSYIVHHIVCRCKEEWGI